MDASIASDAETAELEAMLEDALTAPENQPLTAPENQPLTAPATEAPPRVPDSVARYHNTIRRALLDFGDEIIDKITERFGEVPKILAALEEVRREIIDPLRRAV